jgi:hypothetical protein
MRLARQAYNGRSKFVAEALVPFVPGYYQFSLPGERRKQFHPTAGRVSTVCGVSGSDIRLTRMK